MGSRRQLSAQNLPQRPLRGAAAGLCRVRAPGHAAGAAGRAVSALRLDRLCAGSCGRHRLRRSSRRRGAVCSRMQVCSWDSCSMQGAGSL